MTASEVVAALKAAVMAQMELDDARNARDIVPEDSVAELEQASKMRDAAAADALTRWIGAK